MAKEQIEEKEIREDLSKYSKLEVLAKSKGGKILIASVKSDIVSSISTLITGYKKLSHIEMIAAVAQLESRFGIYQVLNNAEENKHLTKEALERAIKLIIE